MFLQLMEYTGDSEVGLMIDQRMPRRTFELWYVLCEATVRIHRAGQVLPLRDNAVQETHTVIILSEGRGLMHDTRPAFFRHIVIADHFEGARSVLLEIAE
jgi:hypothetical protein